jgi:uncharacterized membrane protein YukC
MRTNRVMHYLVKLVSAIGVGFISLVVVVMIYVIGFLFMSSLAHNLIDDATLKHGEAIEQTE